jgi:hypothetical protein
LLRQPENVAAEILERHGVTLEAVRVAAAGTTEEKTPRETWDALTADKRAARAILTGRPKALALLLAVPQERLDAMERVLEALARKKVRIEVTGSEDSFTVSFPEEPADAEPRP